MAKEAIERKPAKSGLWLFLAKVLRCLVEPAAGVAEEDRRKLKLLSAFLLFITINSLIGAIVIRGMYGDIWVVMLGITVVCAVGYGLSRTRYYKPALIIALCAPALSVIGMVIIGADQTGIMLSLSWLVLPFLLANIFLSRLTTIIVASSYLVFLAFVLLFAGVAYEYMGEILAFFLTVFFLVIAIAVVRQRDQSRVERALVERTQAEEELRINEERFRLLADNASDMIIRIQLSPTFKTDYVSPSSERIIGYKPEEFYADPELGLKTVHPEDRSRFMQYATLKSSEHRPVTLRMVRKDGEVIWTEQTFTTIYDESGKPVAVHAISRDVTERKQMEQALRKSEEKLSKAFNSSPDAMALSTMKDGRFLEVNDSFLRDYGYSREEVIGHSSKELGIWVKPKDRVRILRIMREKGRVVDAEFEARIKSGEIRTMLFSAEPIDIDDEPCLIASTNDITERKRMEEEIQAEKNKLESLIGAMEYNLTIQDKEFNIIYQNELSKLASGGDHVGEKCYRVYEGRETICEGCPVAKAFRDGKSHTSERQRQEPSGEVTFWENTASPIRDAEGNIVSCLELARDITERKRAEQALADEATRRHILIDESSDGIVVLDEKGKVYEANRRFAEMLGYTPEEVRKLSVWDWEAEYPREQVAEMIATIGPEGDHFETRHRRKDGSTIDVEISTNGAVFAGRKLIFCVVRDITERKQMEEALRESEEKYKTLTEDAPIGIYFNDFGGKFLYGNKKAEEIVGYKREELIGQSFLKLKLLSPKEIGRAVKLLALNKLGRATGPDRFVLNRKDGTKTIAEIRTRIATVGGKKVVLGMVEDITEREKAESALKYQRELIDQIIATTPNAVLVIDKEMKVLLANDTFYKHFKLKKAGVENRPIYEVIEDEELKRALSSMIKHNKKSFSFEFWYKLKDIPRIFVATIVKMQSDRYLILVSDVTEERERQERLYLTDRLASVGEMASGVAHELNNPLTSIIGLSSLLAKQDMPAETKEDLTAISAEAQRCAAIVKNLLSFARKHASMKEPLRVTKVVEDVLKLRAYEHRSQGVSVETDLPDDLPEVMADYFQLQQVFLNIILNAEAAMVDANGGGALKITGERTDGYVRLSFSDNGPGIAKENLGLIFNPFFTTKVVGRGTGLGLSISYGIIAAHGGKIQAKNNSDKGATFVVELPVVDN